MSSRSFIIGVLGVLCFSACGGGMPARGQDPHPSASPGPGGQLESPLVLAGSYEISTTLDLTQAGVLPDSVTTTVNLLSRVHSDLGGVMLDLLEASGAPVFSTVIAWLPSSLKSYLGGWINEYVASAVFQSVPVADQLTSLTQDLARVLTQFELLSTLNLPATDAMAHTSASHAPRGAAFTIGQMRTEVLAPDLVTSQTGAKKVDATVIRLFGEPVPVEDGRLELGDHAFGVPVGQYLVRAVDSYVTKAYSAPTLRAALGAMVGCGGLAQDLAARCVGPLCLGHAEDLQAMCEGGLDLLATQVHDALAAVSLDALRFNSGDARMWDAPNDGGVRDGKIDRIDHGEWDASLNLGAGEKAIRVSFTGRRLGEATAPVN